MKIYICGYSRHGKDTVAEYLSEQLELKFISSSRFAFEKFIYDKIKHNYKNKEEAYNDRHNNRNQWFNFIKEYNKDDKSRLSKNIFFEYDIYVGIRNRNEFLSYKKYADLSIWINSNNRKNIEDLSSCTIKEEDCDFTIYNNGDKKKIKLI